MRKLTALVMFAAALAVAGVAVALPPINVDEEGVAIKGYDTVAYFTEGKPVQGSMEFEHEWQGARWQFSSREHLELFRADPEKYAPQYGGY